jgi:hypothetical protein
LNELPHATAAYWPAIDLDVEALWALELPAAAFPVGRLNWHLDLPLWPHEGQSFVLTPRQVLRSPYRYANEYRRIREANLLFPIEITRHNGRWLILDGVRRLAHAHEDGLEEIIVRKVPPAVLRQRG